MNQSQSKLKLPRLISDGMVLQRNALVQIWSENVKLALTFPGTMPSISATIGSCRTGTSFSGEHKLYPPIVDHFE
ncbi:MAG: hypothetical protein WDZ91_02465 [Paenibacillaceae bacterium]